MDCCAGFEFRHQTSVAISAMLKPPATSQADLSLDLVFAAEAPLPGICGPLSMIHLSSSARSLALCHRASGFFVRHFFMVCSSAAGVIGFTVPIGVGSFSNIAEATLNWLFPSKAFFFFNVSYSTAPNEKI